MLVSLWRRLPVVAHIPLGAGTMGVGYVVMTFATSLPIGALGCFIGGLGNGFSFASVIQAIQERTADEYQGGSWACSSPPPRAATASGSCWPGPSPR